MSLGPGLKRVLDEDVVVVVLVGERFWEGISREVGFDWRGDWNSLWHIDHLDFDVKVWAFIHDDAGFALLGYVVVGC